MNISRSGVYRLIAEGQVMAFKVRGSYRIVEASITDYFNRQLATFALEYGEPETVSDSPNVPRIIGGG
jgi:excisionase family DNA binding protein